MFTPRCKPDSCNGCSLHDHGTDFSQPEGTGSSGVLVVAEASGEMEARDNLPLRPYAPAGSIFERAILAAGYTRDMFTVTNMVRCRPRRDWLENSPFEYSALNHCRSNLDQVIKERKPRCILALGGIAFRELTGWAGKNRGILLCQGYVLPSLYDREGNDSEEDGDAIPCIGAPHPSHLRRGAMELFGVLKEFIKKSVQVARNGYAAHATDYTLHPSLDDAKSFYFRVKGGQRQLLTYDIETPKSRDLPEDEREQDDSYQLISIQFSLAPYTGIFFPATEPYLAIARDILALPNRKAGWNNWNYDDSRLRANGFTLNGLREDFMWKWHHLQPDLPMNLQFGSQWGGMDYAWKHMDGPEYGCADVDAPQRTDNMFTEALKAAGTYDSYIRYVRDFHQPVLQPMSDRGIPINDEKRVQFGTVLDEAKVKLDKEIQVHVPDEVKSVHPKQGYKKVPKDISGLIQREFDADAKDNLFTDAPKVLRWCRIEPFLPNGQAQILRYIKHKGHPVPKKFKEVDAEGNAKETTEKKELERLYNKTGDPIYKWCIEYREFSKLKSTYVDGFAPGKDQRVHTTFTMAPAQWQLSARNPSILNWPVHSDLAQEFLKIFEAPEGFTWVAFDWKSFHPAMLAFEAQDADYLRLVRLDIHSYLTAFFERLPDRDRLLSMPDDALRDRLSWVKKTYKHTRDYKCKRVICGFGNGEEYRLCYQQWREYFQNETECKRLFETLKTLFPKVTAHKLEVTQRCSPWFNNPPYLMSRYKAIRWFWETYRYDGKKRKPVPGDDYTKAQAFLGPNDAFGTCRDVMLEIVEKGWDKEYNLVNNIHDALYFLSPKAKVDECIYNVRDVMQRPNPVLIDPVVAPDGMWVETGVKVGRNLADKCDGNSLGLEDVKLPHPPYPLVGALKQEAVCAS